MANKQYKTEITLEDGTMATAFAPTIVSASRSTDIPAFYADWFFHRLNVGYSTWRNPFNGVKSHVSYQNTRFIVFWSKNPAPILPYLDTLEKKGIGCYIQYTLNEYETERLETGVPPTAQRIETFKELSRRLGKAAVIWRFDPLVLSDDITIDDLVEKIRRIGSQIHEYTEKLVFSFADIMSYKRVRLNLERNNVPYHEWEESQMEEVAERISGLNTDEGWGLQLATCGENIDLGRHGITHNRCIDGDLIVRLAWRDKALMDFMGVTISKGGPVAGDMFDNDAIALTDGHFFYSVHKKDQGQRKACLCMAAKDIGEYNTCPHMCEYCYANTSKQAALANWKMHNYNPKGETITGK